MSRGLAPILLQSEMNPREGGSSQILPFAGPCDVLSICDEMKNCLIKGRLEANARNTDGSRSCENEVAFRTLLVCDPLSDTLLTGIALF